MNTKTYLKGAGVLLLAAVLLFSATAVTANTIPTTSYTANIQPQEHQNSRDVVWDNGQPAGGTALSSQKDTAYPFNSQVADDFQFTSQTTITEVLCWGLFWGGSAINPIDMNVIFYNDDGSGNQPTGAGMADPTPTALQVELHTGVGVDNYDGTFTYDMILQTPFVANANTKYWIVFQWVGNFPPQWGWIVSDTQKLHDCMQGFPVIGYPFWTDPGYGDVAYQLMSQEAPKIPNLDASGTLAWTSVKPGATVNATFTVTNIGDDGSLLNWQVATWPSWGTWTFTPSSGTGLAKGDVTTVTVSVVAPPDKKKSFNGTVHIVNTDDATDFVDLTVSLATPLNQGMHGMTFFEQLFERFPHAFPILRHLLGY